MAERMIPLFPLSVVLLPSTPLPLHIFEDRYKLMMDDILPGDQEFGVVLAKQDGIMSIGCSAVVQRVLQRYPDGRLDLIALGQRRFRIESLNQDKPYLRGTVEWMDDLVQEDAPDELKNKAFTAFEKLRALDSPSVLVEPSLADPNLSFLLGQFIQDLDKRQTLLTLQAETERLRFLLSVLPSYTEQREQTALAKRLAPLNGHAKRVQAQTDQ